MGFWPSISTSSLATDHPTSVFNWNVKSNKTMITVNVLIDAFAELKAEVDGSDVRKLAKETIAVGAPSDLIQSKKQ